MDVPEIDIAALEQARAAGAPLIDVRNPEEYVEAHVPGARLIPLGDFVERIDEVPSDGTVYVICASGPRSARATEFLRSKGVDAVNVAGGTMGWIDSGRSFATGEEPG
ncbi:MAG: rhodanese-like domain-containing protein [Actinobacteria bacterium]|nr:rhodanese-like domain-containing protein [Actinomycetota bacterium]